MSAQSCGQTGIDPMEIFGLIVMLIVAAFAQLAQVKLFYIAGIVAVACGLAGDVMNDFKAGAVLGTNPRAQWVGQAIGGIVGALVAAAVMVALVTAYGPDAFGPDKSFVAAQASVVATMVSGIPSVPWFAGGFIAGIVMYWLGIPAMMIGLGVYLPFYMSLTAFLGSCVKLAYDKWHTATPRPVFRTRRRPPRMPPSRSRAWSLPAACWAVSPSSALSWRLSPWD